MFRSFQFHCPQSKITYFGELKLFVTFYFSYLPRKFRLGKLIGGGGGCYCIAIKGRKFCFLSVRSNGYPSLE